MLLNCNTATSATNRWGCHSRTPLAEEPRTSRITRYSAKHCSMIKLNKGINPPGPGAEQTAPADAVPSRALTVLIVLQEAVMRVLRGTSYLWPKSYRVRTPVPLLLGHCGSVYIGWSRVIKAYPSSNRAQ